MRFSSDIVGMLVQLSVSRGASHVQLVLGHLSTLPLHRPGSSSAIITGVLQHCSSPCALEQAHGRLIYVGDQSLLPGRHLACQIVEPWPAREGFKKKHGSPNQSGSKSKPNPPSNRSPKATSPPPKIRSSRAILRDQNELTWRDQNELAW